MKGVYREWDQSSDSARIYISLDGASRICGFDSAANQLGGYGTGVKNFGAGGQLVLDGGGEERPCEGKAIFSDFWVIFTTADLVAVAHLSVFLGVLF